MAGSLTVITGGMYAGKSSELLRYLSRAQYGKKVIQLFKPVIDNRYSAQDVVTHSGNSLTAVVVDSAPDIFSHLDPRTQVVGIDEAQFFDHSIARVVDQLANEGLEVVVAGLNQDSRGVPFGTMPTLLALADTVLSVRAVCVVCGQDACKTYRLASDANQVLVGALGAYEARCRACWKVGTLPA